MIEKIEIHNFQSHKATVIELDPLVNTLQGNSDCGKSAVLRALHWLMFNPAGDYFISDWAGKGKSMNDPCEVILHVNGHRIVRRRDKDFNGYMLDDETFEATRNSVPQKILDILNMGDVNVQRQLDPPFILSMSAGEVSRYINSLVNLTRIDTWTTSASSRERKLKQEVEVLSEREEKARAEVESYSYLPALESLSDDINSIERKLNELKCDSSSLDESVSSYFRFKDELNSYPDIERLQGLICYIVELDGKYSRKRNEIFNAEDDVRYFNLQNAKLDEVRMVDEAENVLELAEGLNDRHEMLNSEFKLLESDVKAYNDIDMPLVPDELFDMIPLLERWRRIRGNILNEWEELANGLNNYDKAMNWKDEVEKDLPTLTAQLDGMVCPLCGRKGMHEEGK